MKTRLCITPGHLALHVQYVWDADMPWQLLLLVEVGYCLCEPQHSLIYVICHYLIRPHPVCPNPPAISCCRLAFFSFINSLPSRRFFCQLSSPVVARSALDVLLGGTERLLQSVCTY